MSDTTKIPNKVRKPFFWMRGRATECEPSTTALRVNPAEPLKNGWFRPSVLKVTAVALALLVMMPTHARGQFGIDIAAILAALSKMQSLMSTYMAAPLKTINQVEQSTAKYEQEVMYPLAAINQAKSSVAQFEGQFSQPDRSARGRDQAATQERSGALGSCAQGRRQRAKEVGCARSQQGTGGTLGTRTGG